MSLAGCAGAVGSAPSPPSGQPGVSVSVTPGNASLLLGRSQAFTAAVSNSANTNVQWSVNGIAGGNASVGTVDATGLYLAPRLLPEPTLVTVRATSAADPSKSAAATVAVNSDIAISVSPQTVPVELGASRAFTAAVTSSGDPDRSVRWLISGAGCAGASCGLIDAGGTYTAPQIMTVPPSVGVTAVSVADPSKSAAAAITITSFFSLTITGPASVGAGATAAYTATLVPVADSNPSRTIAWSVSGAGCSGAACGTISSSGTYTAPALPPSPASVRITATPDADPAKSVFVTVAILAAAVTVTIAPDSATVPLGGAQIFDAVVTGAQDTSVTWEVNSVPGGDSTLGTILASQSTPNRATYTAPLIAPAGGSVTVRARSNAQPSISAAATITFSASISVALTPALATRAIGQRQGFHVQVNNTSNQNVTLQVNGITGGNSFLGQICAAASSPCQQLFALNGGNFDYLAPSGVPSPNPVTLSAISQADPAQSASASITILPHVVVSVLPASSTVSPGGRLGFTASVTGTDNQQVVWTITGAACGAAGACGTIDSSGLYTAPLAVPSPNLINVVATSLLDTGQFASATVTVSGAPNISQLSPSSAYAGSAGGFTLKVTGSGFLASAPGPGSLVIIAGSARATSCTSSTVCNSSLSATDLLFAANLAVRIQNPDGTLSSPAVFAVAAAGAGPDIIPVTPGAPLAEGKDIVVVELSTNGGSGASANVGLSLAAMGAYNTATGTCLLGGQPVVITRPATGSSTADLCLFSVSGLSPSFVYSLSGPVPADLVITSREPLGLGIVRLTLQVPSGAAIGARTVFIENPSKDEAAGSGAIEVR